MFKDIKNLLREIRDLLSEEERVEIGAAPEPSIPVPGPDEELRVLRRSSQPDKPIYYLVKKYDSN